GVISASAGLQGDRSQFQVTAPIQPGNSGGPVYDASGNVTAFVVRKLNDLAALRLIGQLPQNVNFAIRGSEAQEFLRAAGVPPRITISAEELKPADIGERGARVAVLIDCRR